MSGQIEGNVAIPPIRIFHLEGRRSERLVWLLEELGIEYDLVFERGNLFASMDRIKGVSPGMPLAPTTQIGDQTLVESGAALQIILERFAGGRLQPEPLSEDYVNHVMWIHFAEGTFAARVFSDYRAWLGSEEINRSPLMDGEGCMNYVEAYLEKRSWFGGEEFSAADIMMLFPIEVATRLNVVDEERFPFVARWRERVTERPAYARMLTAARPDGMVGMLPKLDQSKIPAR